MSGDHNKYQAKMGLTWASSQQQARNAAQPEPEPMAWCIVENGRIHGLVKSKPAVMNAEKWQPLYTAPPQREWQGLTDEEIRQLEIMEDEEEERKGWCDPKLLIAWTQALLKEKNK